MSQPEFVHTKTLTFPGCIARVFSPVLTDEERKRRTEAIKTASINLVKEVLKNEKVIEKSKAHN